MDRSFSRPRIASSSIRFLPWVALRYIGCLYRTDISNHEAGRSVKSGTAKRSGWGWRAAVAGYVGRGLQSVAEAGVVHGRLGERSTSAGRRPRPDEIGRAHV